MGNIPYVLKSVKTGQFQGNIQTSRKFLEVFRNDVIFKFCIENQVSWLELSGKYTLYIEISQNWPIPGQYPEFQEISGSFQEWSNFKILHWKSSSLTKIEWEIYLIYWNQSKVANSRAFLESWNPGFQNPEVITFSKKCKKSIQICYIG